MSEASDASVISGLSAIAEKQLRMVVREEVQAGIAAALDDPTCPRPCDRVAGLEAVTYGNGSGGLKHRVTVLETQMEDVIWAKRASIGAAIAAIGSLVVSLWR